MKKILFAAAALVILAVSVLAFAAGNPQPGQAGQTFEQRQANVLQMLDQRIAGLQEAKACIQAAKSDDDLRACREKHMAEMRDKRGGMRPGRGMMGGPQGQ